MKVEVGVNNEGAWRSLVVSTALSVPHAPSNTRTNKPHIEIQRVMTYNLAKQIGGRICLRQQEPTGRSGKRVTANGGHVWTENRPWRDLLGLERPEHPKQHYHSVSHRRKVTSDIAYHEHHAAPVLQR